MNELMAAILILAFLLFVLVIWATLGHFCWVAAGWLFRQFFPKPSPTQKYLSPLAPSTWFCLNCGTESQTEFEVCRACGVRRPNAAVLQIMQDLAASERQLERFLQSSRVDVKTYDALQAEIQRERLRLKQGDIKRPVQAEPDAGRPESEITVQPTPSVVTAALTASEDAIVIEPTPPFQTPPPPPPEEPRFTPPPAPPRRAFAEVLNTFMEQSNIRWGEIIGGLLIIGCSTALTVSLWAEISQIPVLKFLIFTTVTAFLFGIGLYTEHRWKLPTTSRGILTIATLLVPLNFLAIAAVSSSSTGGPLVIGSELLAPAIFLCLVYFAGRVITPGCAQLLAGGVLGSSVGQLLVRHFVSADTPPFLLVFLGAFPVICYLIPVGLTLRRVLDDLVIDENETGTVFTILGTMSFAALLPFGLLLYKAGPLGLTMMYLAPVVTLWGLPMLATGTVLWRLIKDKQLVAARTTGTALGIMGAMIALAGMILAWPNPASIVPTALLNFAVFTALAITLELPIANLIAATCLALAYLVLFHVLALHIAWLNLRVMSLLNLMLSVSSGQALAGAVVLFLGASEWLTRRKRAAESYYYLIATCAIAVISLLLVSFFGILPGEAHTVWPVFALYAIGAFWVASSRRLAAFSWIASALLFFAFVQAFVQSQFIPFPWQTALLTHASVCAIGAIASSRSRRTEVFTAALSYSSLATAICAILFMFQANPWQTTSSQAIRIFWLAGIWLLLLWENPAALLFVAFQTTITVGVVMSIKGTLQQFEWYEYLPHAFLHPWSLQIQGTALVLLGLFWTTIRLAVRRLIPTDVSEETTAPGNRTSDLGKLVLADITVDRMVLWSIVPAFWLLVIYGNISGVTRELAAYGADYTGWNIAGFPHQEALGLGSWLLLGLLAITLLANVWERKRGAYLVGALAVVTASVPLLAGRFEVDVATASAWRWFAAVFLISGSAALWYRERLTKALAGSGWPELVSNNQQLVTHLRRFLFAAALVPIVILTAYPTIRAINYLPVRGPASGIFSGFDEYFSYSFPLILVAVALLGSAIRERTSRHAIAAGFFLNAAATVAYLLSVAAASGQMNRVVLVRTVQLNAITCSLYVILWASLNARWRSLQIDRLMKVNVAIALALNALLIVPSVVAIFWGFSTGAAALAIGDVIGIAGFGVSSAAMLILKRSLGERLSASALTIFLLATGSLLALNQSADATPRSLQLLTIATCLTSWLMLLTAELSEQHFSETLGIAGKWLNDTLALDANWKATSRGCSAILGVVGTVLSIRLLAEADANPWWTVSSVISLSALFGVLNSLTLRRGYLYAAGLLFNFAATVWWLKIVNRPDSSPGSIVEVNVIAFSLAGIVWLLLELQARRSSGDVQNPERSFHNMAAIISLAALTILTLNSFVLVVPGSWGATPNLTWFAIASTALLLLATLWDIHARYAVPALYWLGLVASAVALIQAELPYTRFAWSAAIILSIFALTSALAWRLRLQILSVTRRFRIPPRLDPARTHLVWLAIFNVVAVAIVIGIAYWVELRFLSFGLRATAALAVVVHLATFGLLAEGEWKRHWQRAAIAVFGVGAIFLGWSWLTPGLNATWLNRSVILMVETFALTALYGWGLDRAKAPSSEWTEAIRKCLPWILGSGLIALFFCLATEIFYQISFGAVRINNFSLATIGITLAVAVIICLLFALSPAHDPLGLSERGRMSYVYAAEVMLALLFLHIRLTLPWLFTGFFERYWPVVVMAIAYLGVVASEALRRRKLLVLAQPLEKTGVFLPLLPVVGFWLAQSRVDYSVLLFITGGLYGLLSILRRSFMFGIVAAVAGNGGLWYLWHQTADYQFLQHPQLWLIPVALSVLLAAYLNEDNLTEDQMAGIRYLSLVTIYVSSTADIFINGVANSPWLPLVLGALSLAGVFAGIVFRIRGLLLLGSVFLLLAIVTMIWYASANLGWTWLWYVAGIVTGATIIFMFALFEKKRTEVLRMMEGLKEWER